MTENKINFEVLQAMIDCAKREVKLRYSVYPKWVQTGRMTYEDSEKEKALMYAIQKALQKIYDGTAPKPVQQSFINAQEYITPKIWKGG
jgi:hypothetical protein